jgi:hypothetical protein
MVLYAVESGALALCDRSTADNVADFFEYITAKYHDLMESGNAAPRRRPAGAVGVHHPRVGACALRDIHAACA